MLVPPQGSFPSNPLPLLPLLSRACLNPGEQQLCPDLMPVCKHFLEGVCSSQSCPYLHVNYGPDVPPCPAFLHGYCPQGVNCPKRHVTGQMAKEMRKSKRRAWSEDEGEEGGAGATAGGSSRQRGGREGGRGKRMRGLGI
jgi:hypothetical protein